MSIDSKEFEKHKNPLKYILDFLRSNADRAFTAEFIAKQTGLEANEVARAILYEQLAGLIGKDYRSQIDKVSFKGEDYYKYKGA
jgi:hypothetical protein